MVIYVGHNDYFVILLSQISFVKIAIHELISLQVQFMYHLLIVMQRKFRPV